MTRKAWLGVGAIWILLIAGVWLAPAPSSKGCLGWNAQVKWGGDLRCGFSTPVASVRKAIGEVSVPDAEDGRNGTVFLVAPDVVVTAAHLMLDPKTGAYREPEVVSFPTNFGGRERASVREVIVGPFDPAARRSRGDWAVLKISPLEDRPVLPMGEVCEGRLHVVGYTGPTLPRESVCKLVEIPAYPYDKRAVIWTSCDATNGMSGGPILEERDDGTVRVVGVLSLELARKPPWSFGPAMTEELRMAVRELSDFPATTFELCETGDQPVPDEAR